MIKQGVWVLHLQMGLSRARAERTGEWDRNQNRVEEMHAIQLNAHLYTQIIIAFRQDMECLG